MLMDITTPQIDNARTEEDTNFLNILNPGILLQEIL